MRKDECPECGSDNVSLNKSKEQLICKDCGSIFEELSPEDEKSFESAHDRDYKEE